MEDLGDRWLRNFEGLADRLETFKEELEGQGALLPHSEIHSIYLGVAGARSLLHISYMVLLAQREVKEMPLPPDLPTDDPDLNDAREFSIDELAFLIAWLKAALANDPVSAEDILQTGLVAEHYRSRLFFFGTPPPTPAQIDVLDKLRIAAKAARDRGGYG